MVWETRAVSSQRAEFVSLARQEGANISELCRRFEISRPTAYKWVRRFEEEGAAGLEDRSHRPQRSPRQTAPETEEAIVGLRTRHPHWGGRKLRRLLQRDGVAPLPAASTVTRVLHRRGLITPSPSHHKPWERFEAAAPNLLWQMDFKGPLQLTDGPVYLLASLDDHSRYATMLRACPDQRAETVREALTATFRRYGLPREFLVDNGAPWGSDQDHPHTVLTAWLLQLGVDVSHGRPYHPQTQGKVERFNGTLEAELLRDLAFADRTTIQPILDGFRLLYNSERPHQALGYATPLSRYRPSLRRFTDDPGPITYEPGDEVRIVQAGGWFTFEGRAYHVSKAFRGYPIALRRSPDSGYGVYFCHKLIGTIEVGS